MSAPVLTRELAYAAARDAGNRSARKAGRQKWSQEDYDASVTEYHRIWRCPPDVACEACAETGRDRT